MSQRFQYLAFPNGEKNYSCVYDCLSIIKNRPINVYGRHLHGHSDDHVQNVQFYFCRMNTIPRGLMDRFPNLKMLTIYRSRLSEITKNDLMNYKNLERFYCNNNELEILPGDLFEDLKIIEANILDGLNNLKLAKFLK